MIQVRSHLRKTKKGKIRVRPYHRAPLYLRDLSRSIRETMIADWKRAGLKKLVKEAEKEEHDIEIGEYFDEREVEVEK